MSDRFLTRELEKAGAQHRVDRIPDPMTLEFLQEQCDQLERIYRLQLPDKKLDLRDEHELATTQPPSTMIRAMRRWAFLKHLYYRRSEGLVRTSGAVSDVEAEEAARKMLTRVPEVVYLGDGISAHLTGRSYNAMYHIAAHWQAIRLLDLTLGEVESVLRRLESRPQVRGTRKRFARMVDMHARVCAELREQRRWLYAHALTEDGAPAVDTEHLPAWWETIDAVSDVRLLMGLFQVGRGRHATMVANDRPKDPAEQDPGDDESLGWASLFASIEDRRKLPRGSLFDHDLWQEMAAMRAARRPQLGES